MASGEVSTGSDGTDDAIEVITLAGTGGWDGGGDENESDVLCVLHFLRTDGDAHAFHDGGKAAMGGGEVSIAGSIETDDEPHCLEGVLFLALDAAEGAELRAGGNGTSQERQEQSSDECVCSGSFHVWAQLRFKDLLVS